MLQDRKKLTAVTPPQSLLLLPIRSPNFVGISIILLSNRILTQKSDRCLLWGILMARESGFPAGPPEICFSSPPHSSPTKKKKSCTTPCYDCVSLPTTINITVVLRSYVAVFQRGSHRNICSSEVKNGNVDTSYENGAVTWAIEVWMGNRE